MPDYRKALLFSKLERKQEYTAYEPNALVATEVDVCDPTDLYLKQIQQYDMLEKEQEKKLIIQAQADNLEAREQLIHANLRLVVRIARRYRRPGVSLPDLIAEGNFGLIHAIRKFDASLDIRFSTYAAWWIQHYVEYYLLNQSRVVRLPVHVSKKISKIEKAEKQILQQTQSAVQSSRQVASYVGLTLEDLNQLKIWSDPVTSIDHQEDTPFSASILDDHSDQEVHDEFLQKQDTELQHNVIIESLIGVLNDLERDIVLHRTGLGGFEEMTFEQIGVHMDLKKDRARCIYQKALKKMLKQHQEQSLMKGRALTNNTKKFSSKI